MDVAVGEGVQRTGFTDLQRGGCLVMCVHGTLVGTAGGLAVGAELEMPYVMGELASLRVEVQADPPDVVFRGVGMGDLLPETDLHLEELIRPHLVRTFDDRHVLLCPPVCSLDAIG
jgi:hypothetical protein